MSHRSDIELARRAALKVPWPKCADAVLFAAWDLGRAAQADADARYAYYRATSLGAMDVHATEIAKRLRAKVRRPAGGAR